MASTFDINVARGLMLGDGFRKTVVKITGPASYSAGGETITPGTFRLGAIEYWPPAVLIASSGAASMVIAAYNDVTGKLQYFYGGGPGSGSGGSEFSFTPSDLKGATTIVSGSVTTDKVSAPVNSTFYQAATANSGLAGTCVLTGGPDVARNVQITFINDTAGNLELYSGGGTITFTITGKFRGAAQTETIVFTVTSGQSPIAHAPDYRFKQGLKPFDTITSITYDHTADIAATLKISVGPGSLIGLPVNRLTPADADVLTFAISGVATTVAGAFSDTNHTVETGTTADAWDLQLVYLTAGGEGEVGAGTDLSGYVGRALVHGK